MVRYVRPSASEGFENSSTGAQRMGMDEKVTDGPGTELCW